jgi:hypothetical protein
MDILITAGKALTHIRAGWPADLSRSLPPVSWKPNDNELEIPQAGSLSGDMDPASRQIH